jgi:hypothetical protein
VFTEDALACDGGGVEVRREQLERLLQLVEQHPDITMQVLRSGDTRNPVQELARSHADTIELIRRRLQEDDHVELPA